LNGNDDDGNDEKLDRHQKCCFVTAYERTVMSVCLGGRDGLIGVSM
jgi:hypothetical protein